MTFGCKTSYRLVTRGPGCVCVGIFHLHLIFGVPSYNQRNHLYINRFWTHNFSENCSIACRHFLYKIGIGFIFQHYTCHCRRFWNGYVVALTNLPSLVTMEVVVMTTSGPGSDYRFVNVAFFSVLWAYWVLNFTQVTLHSSSNRNYWPFIVVVYLG